jgi:hypothetical protein
MPRTEHLTRPEGERLVAAPPLLGVALGGGERGQERQRPPPARPGQGDQPPPAHPAQPVHFDAVAAAGADRVPVDAGGGDLGPTPALDGLVDAQHQRPFARKGGDQQSQQEATGAQTRPDGPAEDPMVRLEVPDLAESDGA